MTRRDQNLTEEPEAPEVNPAYASWQLAKAFTTAAEHEDPAVRERAREKVEKWEQVLRGIFDGTVKHGSRTPLGEVPPWATLEVITGGFATGDLLASGPLLEHELALLRRLPAVLPGDERRAINSWYLTDSGLQELQDLLLTTCYEVNVPEETALLVVAWLLQNRHVEQARELVDTLAPFFNRLRFYPVPTGRPLRTGTRVHLQDVGKTLEDLRKLKPNRRVAAQKEAVEIWAPFYDRMVSLFLDRPAADWSVRATAMLAEYARLRARHRLCGKPEKRKEHFAQLLALLEHGAPDPQKLGEAQLRRLEVILDRYVAKRGAPGTPENLAQREREARAVAGPTHYELVAPVTARLAKYPNRDALPALAPLEGAIAAEEARTFEIAEGTPIPASILRRVRRCLEDNVAALVERGIITSGDTLAVVLPQLVSGLRATGIADAVLRQVYAANYQAFRRRRSLLLLNLESQVRIEELPWVAVLERFRDNAPTEHGLARQALDEITTLTLAAFPFAILPNKLLQELRALTQSAELKIPLVDEIAADIFMGQFSEKFVAAAQIAAELLEGSLYARYYAIDFAGIRSMCVDESREKPKTFFARFSTERRNGFAEMCAARAGVQAVRGDVVTNGMILEQQQILTTQNLAVLYARLGLADALRQQLLPMARTCFEWVCRRQQMKIDDPHARLIMLKNTAYAWRQMMFFLSVLDLRSATDWLDWARAHFAKQQEDFRTRFAPAMKGLELAFAHRPAPEIDDPANGARRFLGWSKATHWLMPGGIVSH